jgi:hypothetical protein
VCRARVEIDAWSHNDGASPGAIQLERLNPGKKKLSKIIVKVSGISPQAREIA